MKYMLLIYGTETAIDEDERQACMVESTAVCHDLAAKGQFLGASPLHPVSTATSVRIREGRKLVTDGPFAETVEQLGGYYLIDVPNLDEAIAVASKLPPSKWGTVEIRPIYVLDDIPEPSRNEPAEAGADLRS
ncbi:YciI family protein [bacterium]|nr:YciI family protein [bacterium]